MADLRVALRTHLLTKLAVTTLVGQRIYSDELPQTATLPAVVITCLDDDSVEHISGSTGLAAGRLLVKAYANTTVASEGLRETILDADVQDYSNGAWGSVWMEDVILEARPNGVDEPTNSSDQRRRWTGAALKVWHVEA